MKYIILGIIQGLSEFLPVSSSGHLVIAQKILGIDSSRVLIVLVCHLGTIFALTFFFSKDIIRLLRQGKLLGQIILVTLITGVIGVLGKAFFESLFSLPRVVGFALLLNGMILISSARFIQTNRGMNAINAIDAIYVGVAQALAIIPGISRSGITISTLLLRKIDKEGAFKFSFLAAIPAILGAWLLEAKGQLGASSLGINNLFLCFFFSFFSGLFGLRILRLVLFRAKLHYFGYYCLLAGTVAIIFFK